MTNLKDAEIVLKSFMMRSSCKLTFSGYVCYLRSYKMLQRDTELKTAFNSCQGEEKWQQEPN